MSVYSSQSAFSDCYLSDADDDQAPSSSRSTRPRRQEGSWDAVRHDAVRPPAIRVPGLWLVGQGIPGDAMRRTTSPVTDTLRHTIMDSIRHFHDKKNDTKNKVNKKMNEDDKDIMQSVHAMRDILDQEEMLAKAAGFQAWRLETDNLHHGRRDARFYQPRVPKPWWIHYDYGYLATFGCLRDVHPKGAPSGKLAPGTPIHGLEIHEISNPLQALENPLAPQETKPILPLGRNSKLLPWNFGQPGQILVLKYRLVRPAAKGELQEGYCVYSVDGYSFLQPGGLEEYVERYVQKVYWKVTSLQGAHPVPYERGCGTILPYGALVQVLHRRHDVNNKNDHHVYVKAVLWDLQLRGYKQVTGWYQERHEGAQHGNLAALQPLPLAVPVVFKIVLPHGIAAKRKKKSKSEKLYFLPNRTLVSVTDWGYTKARRSGDFDVQRWYAAGCGWFSKQCQSSYYQGRPVAEPLFCDSSFDPSKPQLFQYRMIRHFIQVDMAADKSRLATLKHGVADVIQSSPFQQQQQQQQQQQPPKQATVELRSAMSCKTTEEGAEARQQEREKVWEAFFTSYQRPPLSRQFFDSLSEPRVRGSQEDDDESTDSSYQSSAIYSSSSSHGDEASIPARFPCHDTMSGSLHEAVAQGDTVQFQIELSRAIREGTINRIDAENRTALDVAGLTGEPEFFIEIKKVGGKSSFFHGDEHKLESLVHDCSRESEMRREQICSEYSHSSQNLSLEGGEEDSTCPWSDSSTSSWSYERAFEN